MERQRQRQNQFVAPFVALKTLNNQALTTKRLHIQPKQPKCLKSNLKATENQKRQKLKHLTYATNGRTIKKTPTLTGRYHVHR